MIKQDINLKAIILTEGKTDLLHLKKAFEKLSLDMGVSFPTDVKDRGDSKLIDYCEKLSTIPYIQTIPMIFIFDRDNPDTIKKVTCENSIFKNWGNNIYSFALPIPKHRKGSSTISIEHYYTNDELKIQDENGRRLYLSNEFNPTSGQHLVDPNIHYGNNSKLKTLKSDDDFKIIDSQVFKNHKNIALSKSDFSKSIYDEKELFKNVSFEAFEDVFKIVKLILESNQKEADEFQVTLSKGTNVSIGKKHVLYNDFPPTVPIFVGRHDDLSKIDQNEIRVISITGLGGEGKSTLAAKYFELATRKLTKNIFDKYGWYDCKELETPFHEKLSSLLEMLTNGAESKEKYSDENVIDTINRFIDFLNRCKTLIVFDNVDAFVNKDTSSLTGNFKILFENLLSRLKQSLVIFTARSPIEDYRFSYLEVPILGLKYDEALELVKKFGIYKTLVDDTSLRFIHVKSKGHALWLNLIFAQLRSTRLNAAKVNDIFSKPSDVLDSYLLNSIWDTLTDFEKEIIWIISTFSRPPDIEKIEKASSKSYQKCQKALTTLERLRLVIEIDIGSVIHYDLHPIIMMKSKEECKPHKRALLVERIITLLSLGNWRLLVNIVNSNENYTDKLDGYIECAEIAINHNDHKKAIQFIDYLVYPLNKYGEDIKFIQLCRDLFKIIDIDIQTISNDLKLSTIVESYLKILLEQGEFVEVDALINKMSLQVKTIKELICFCTLQSYNLWFQNRFQDAIEFIESIVAQIKAKNEVVPKSLFYDLALAKRDNGEVKYCIDFHLSRNSQEYYDSWDPKGGNDISADIGNLGRCYYLIGDYDKASNYLQRSIEFLKRDKSRHGKVNYGYGLLWLSDVYIKVKNYELSKDHLNRAIEIWSKYCPSRLKKIEKHIEAYPKNFKEDFKIDVFKLVHDV